MNEFEKNVQSKNSDVIDSIKGVSFSLLFFLVIFFLGTVFEVVGR